MVGHKATHREWTPPPALAAEYRTRKFPFPATLFDDFATRNEGAPRAEMTLLRDLSRDDLKLDPPAGIGERDLVRWRYQRLLQDYLACARSLDDNVGRLLGWLDGHGLAENTVVVYTSDNGFFLGEHGWFDKRWMYEPSLRVPLLVRWPGAPQGRVPDAFALNVDLAPTFLEAAGLPVPAAVQGASLRQVLHDKLPIEWRQVMYYRYYEYPGTHSVPLHYGVRSHVHKLIYFPEFKTWEMYDLEKDPLEVQNVADDKKYRGYRQDLEGELKRLRAQFGDDDQVKVR
jgi:arylsulfatase A-like enzyme